MNKKKSQSGSVHLIIIITIIVIIVGLLGFALYSNIAGSRYGGYGDTVISSLNNKYNEKFVIDSISKNGDPFTSDNDATYKAYCYKLNNKDLLFEATLNKDKTVSDNYGYKLLEKQTNDVITQKFSNNGLDVVVYSNFYNEANKAQVNKDVILSSYINNNKPEMLIINIAIRDNSTSTKEEVTQSIKDAYESLAIKAQYKVYIIDPSKFADVEQHRQNSVAFSKTNVESYSLDDYALEIDGGLVKSI